MRRFATIISTFALALSGLATTSTNSVASVQGQDSNSTTHFATALPAIFATEIQNNVPNDEFNSISCSSAGNCVAAGRFKNADGGYEAFTQTQTGGIWEEAKPATFGVGIQNTTPDDEFYSVSCSSAGNCVAAGYFKNATGGSEAFTQTQTGGNWAQPEIATFGVGIQNATPNDKFESVSCSSPGNCVAAGYFKNATGGYEAFTQTQVGGNWAQPEIATFALNVQHATPNDEFESVSCSSTGNCVAAGYFKNATGGSEAFTQTQTDGIWEDAKPATFAARIQNTEPNDGFESVSCSSAGNCVAAGGFKNIGGKYEAFTQTQTGGTWAPAKPATFAPGIRGTANSYSHEVFSSVSCSSSGNCVAVGGFKNVSDNFEAFTQTQTDGTWATAKPATFATGIQSTAPDGYFESVSCPSVGNCVAAGYFIGKTGYEAFTQSEAPNTYTVTYDYSSANGGNTLPTGSFTTGGTAITLPTPVRTGYIFDGWYSDSGFVTKIGDGGSNYSPRGSTLALNAYARWTIDSAYVAAQAAAADLAARTIKVKSKFAGKALASRVGVKMVSPKAKVTFKISKASKKICTKSGSKIKTLKAGNCMVTFTVQEPKPKKGKKPKATKTVKTLVVQ